MSRSSNAIPDKMGLKIKQEHVTSNIKVMRFNMLPIIYLQWKYKIRKI